MKNALSERIRPDVEAAKWVRNAVIELESALSKALAETNDWRVYAVEAGTQNVQLRLDLLNAVATLEQSDKMVRARMARVQAERENLLETVESVYEMAVSHNEQTPFDWAVLCETLYQAIKSAKESDA